ncbi:MAG: tRNA threonylcarbamoyladenosine dehydratase [Clostridia bacterium]|nr:tRNA threonylcarbamoyladenosine dehydratase [Clostridia bacterium]
MQNEFSRTELLLGKEAMEKLKAARVVVFGIGGVGSFAVEALARSGIGAIDVVDNDKICLTNINRQLLASHSTLGQEKVTVMKRRILDINPACSVHTFPCFYGAETADSMDLTTYSYIIDAIDTVSSKLLLIERAKAHDIPIISCMGAGNKLDPTRFEVADIYKTSVCPLARVMRHELKKRQIDSLKVVYSKEAPLSPREDQEISGDQPWVCLPETPLPSAARRQVPGSLSFVPPVAGFILASEVIKDLAQV